MNDKAKKSEVTRKIAERHQDVAAQSWLAEYQSIKNEILHIDRIANTLISLNITAAGVILGGWKFLSEQPHIYFLLFLIFSFVSSCLGLIWVAGQRRIIRANSYINNTIAPYIRSISNNAGLFQQEEESRTSFSIFNIFKATRHRTLIEAYMLFIPSIFSFCLAIYGLITQNLWSPWYYIGLLIIASTLLITLTFNVVQWYNECLLKEYPY